MVEVRPKLHAVSALEAEEFSPSCVSRVKNKLKLRHPKYEMDAMDKCIECLKSFQKGRSYPSMLIVDGYPARISKKVTDYLDLLKEEVEMVFLPSYAPDLSPDELVWNQMRIIGP